MNLLMFYSLTSIFDIKKILSFYNIQALKLKQSE